MATPPVGRQYHHAADKVVMMASLRSLGISLLRLAGHLNVAKTLRRNARKPKRALKLVTTS
jgi:hypothetical protein